MSFYDDEAIPLIEERFAVAKPKPFIDEKVKLTVINKNKAPLEATNFTVLLELEGNGSKEDTPGVDIVTVLDVSGSMGDDNKLEKMKRAMQFLIKKLSPIHRLSVVTFSTRPNGMSPLRRMTENALEEIGRLVDDLQAGGGTNIAGGLRMALEVLNKRKVYRGRVAAIMLMSDGDQGLRYEDARNVLVGEVPVFTFGFGKGSDYNPQMARTKIGAMKEDPARPRRERTLRFIFLNKEKSVSHWVRQVKARVRRLKAEGYECVDHPIQQVDLLLENLPGGELYDKVLRAYADRYDKDQRPNTQKYSRKGQWLLTLEYLKYDMPMKMNGIESRMKVRDQAMVVYQA